MRSLTWHKSNMRSKKDRREYVYNLHIEFCLFLRIVLVEFFFCYFPRIFQSLEIFCLFCSPTSSFAIVIILFKWIDCTSRKAWTHWIAIAMHVVDTCMLYRHPVVILHGAVTVYYCCTMAIVPCSLRPHSMNVATSRCPIGTCSGSRRARPLFRRTPALRRFVLTFVLSTGTHSIHYKSSFAMKP